MQDLGTGYYKIGVSVNPKLREKTLLSQAPQILLIDSWPSNTAYKHEAELHAIFKDVRVRGEWFALDSEGVFHVRSFFGDTAPMPIKSEQPSQPIQIEPKDALAAFIAKAQAKKGIAPSEIIVSEPEPIDDGWIEMPTTIENGETLYWHRKIKGAPVCYKRETNWDNFA